MRLEIGTTVTLKDSRVIRVEQLVVLPALTVGKVTAIVYATLDRETIYEIKFPYLLKYIYINVLEGELLPLPELGYDLVEVEFKFAVRTVIVAVPKALQDDTAYTLEQTARDASDVYIGYPRPRVESISASILPATDSRRADIEAIVIDNNVSYICPKK